MARHWVATSDSPIIFSHQSSWAGVLDRPAKFSISLWMTTGQYLNGSDAGRFEKISDALETGATNFGTFALVTNNNAVINRIQFYALGWSNGTTAVDANWHITAPAASATAWHHVAVTYDSSSTSNVPIMYLDGVSQSVTNNVAASGTYTSPDTGGFIIGGDINAGAGANSFAPALSSQADCAYWAGIVLTPAEVKQLALGGMRPGDIRPNTPGLFWVPCGQGSKPVEYDVGPFQALGFSRQTDGTAVVHSMFFPDPPRLSAILAQRPFRAAFGATTALAQSKTVSAAVANAPALSRAASAARTKALTLSSSLSRAPSHALAASISGSASLARQAARTLAASLSAVATAVAGKQSAKALSASASSAATLLRTAGKTIAANLSMARSLSRTVSIARAVTLASAYVLSRSVSATRTKAIALSASLSRAATHLLAASASLVATASPSKASLRTVAAAASAAAALVRSASVTRTRALTPSASLARSAAHLLSAALATSISLSRSVSAKRTVAIGPSASLARVASHLLAASASLVATASPSRASLRTVAATVAAAAKVSRSASIVRSVASAASSSLSRLVSKTLSAQAQPSVFVVIASNGQPLTGVTGTGSLGSLSITSIITQFLTALGIGPVGGIGPISISVAVPSSTISIPGIGPSGGIGAPSIVQLAVTTSQSFLFSLDYLDIITEAFERNGLSPEAVGAAEITDALRTINLIYARWSNAIDLDANIDLQVQPLAAGQASFFLPPASSDILSMVVSWNGSDLPMRRIPRAEWAATVNKLEPGLPSVYYVERLSASVNINIWMPPDRDSSVSYYRSRQFQDAAHPADTTGLPPRWQEAICAELAARIAGKMRGTLAKVLRADADAAFARASAGERNRSRTRLLGPRN